MSAPDASDARTVVLRPPLRAYVAGALLGAAGALLPYVAPRVASPWSAERLPLALSAFGALAAHALLHAVFPRPAGAWPRFVAATLLPFVAVTLASATVLLASSELRACAYAALVANATASALDVWEAAVLTAARPTHVCAVGSTVEFTSRL